MENKKRWLTETATGEITDKKSKFIAVLQPVNSEEQAEQFIESVRKKYYDAKHHCTAMIIVNDEENVTKCNDDGEPSQTAGKPMLEVLAHENLVNVVAVVTRYFGGVLLGTGGLIRAYQGAVKEALRDAKIGVVAEGYLLSFSMDYTFWPKIQYMISQRKLELMSSQYMEKVEVTVRIHKEELEEVTEEIVRITCGQAILQEPVRVSYVDIDNEV